MSGRSHVWCFFSSRRRHTRLSCDWSSDVCSSDLSRGRHTRLSCDWSSDVCSSDLSEEHTSELQSHDNLVCRLQTCALPIRSEEHTSELQSHANLVCRLLLEKQGRAGGRSGPKGPSEVQSLGNVGDSHFAIEPTPPPLKSCFFFIITGSPRAPPPYPARPSPL